MALSRRTQVRYLLGVITLAIMLLAPAATFVFYLQQNSGSPQILKSVSVAAITSSDLVRDSSQHHCEVPHSRRGSLHLSIRFHGS